MFDVKGLLDEAEQMSPYLSKCYRTIHQHPELSHQEQGTNRFIREELMRWGIPFLASADNITIAVVQGEGAGAVIGVRCDTDALPVQEETGLPFASQTPGVMHACGHDGHTAMGLAAVRMLAAHRAELSGTVKVIFQPAEEGENGSDQVIATGLVDDVDAFFAIHLWSAWSTGTLHAAPVTVSAAVNMFTLRVKGKGGHGAAPDQCADALAAAAAIVGSAQTIVSRNLPPMEPAVVTIGSLNAGTAGNVIAEEAVLRGTIRTLNSACRQLAEESLARIAKDTASAYGCTVEVENLRVSDAVINDPRITQIALKCARQLAPEERIGGQETLMLGDNFANFGAIAPYCYMQLGIADEAKGTHWPHHNGHFCIDEAVLPIGAAWLASCCMTAGRELDRA